MTAKLFAALYIGLIAGMIVLFIFNFPVAWVFYTFVFVTVFGGILLISHPRLIASFFLAPGLIVLGIGLAGMQRPWQARGWPTASAVITRSRSCGSSSCLDYYYKVNGETYQASSVNSDEFDTPWSQGAPASYQAGQEVKIYYDPRHPANTRLTAEVAPRDWVTAAVGGVMTGLSALTLVHLALKRKAQAPMPKTPSG